MSDIETSTPLGCLYHLYYRCWDACQDPGDPYGQSPDHQCHEVVAWPITKRTAKRVYFVPDERPTVAGRVKPAFVDRAELETDGEAWHAPTRTRLKVEPPALPLTRRQRAAQNADNLPPLKQAMADAHPDRGGDRDTFQAARERYLRAKGGAA